MTAEQIRAHIRKMKNRRQVNDIISTAEARASALLDIEVAKERAKLYAKYAPVLKPGTTVYIGDKREALASSKWKLYWARPLIVAQAKPRKKEWVLKLKDDSKLEITLTAHMAHALKVDKHSNAEAMADALALGRSRPHTSRRKNRRAPVSEGRRPERRKHQRRKHPQHRLDRRKR